MAQNDTKCSNNESINRANHRTNAFGKQVCHMYPQCSNQIGQYEIVMPSVGRNCDLTVNVNESDIDFGIYLTSLS